MSAHEFAQEWSRWHAQRELRVAGPGGDLTLTGTHWVHGETVIAGVPGVWRPEAGGVRVRDGVGLTRDGQPVPDALLRPGEAVAAGDVTLAVIRRGDDVAVRTFDPHAPAVRDFAGIDAYPPDEAWALTARFDPVPAGRTEHLAHSNSDREVDYPVVGTFTFTVDGHDATLTALHTGHDGEAHITFRDATSGVDSYGAARFLFLPLPAGRGPVALDFNRATLPPCAFSDAFICPLPPPGNVLPFAVRAGEKRVLQAGA